jgi:hypothetical protein
MEKHNRLEAISADEVLDGVKIAFDIGGVISRYPERMMQMMSALLRGGVEVYIITDMNQRDALATCEQNSLLAIIGPERVFSADWSAHGDRCKTEVCKKLGIDVLIDDRPDYCAEGDFIGLVLSPRPHVPYYASGWSNAGTSAVCVPPEEYESFKKWKTAQCTHERLNEDGYCRQCGADCRGIG